MNNSVVNWIEVNSPDPEATFSFYSGVFGWDKSEADMGEMGMYTMFHESGNPAPFAGIMKMTSPEWDGIPPHWMTYFHTSDIAATCKAVGDNGGKVCYEPFDVPGTGKLSMCTDPHGANFSIHQPGDNPGADPSPVTWYELYSPNPEEAKAFYSSTFPWTAQDYDMGDFMYPMFFLGDRMFAGIMNTSTPEMESIPPNWLIYFYTADIAATVEKVTANGGSIVNGTMEVPGVGQIAIVADNHGATFAVHQPVPQE